MDLNTLIGYWDGLNDYVRTFPVRALKTIPVLALFFAGRSYWLKWGTRIRGRYTITSSATCGDPYVSSVVLENAKDRAVSIYTIYLQIGPNIFLTIHEFGDAPLILKAFETYRKAFDPVEGYFFNGRRIKFTHLLHHRGSKQRLVLSTSAGRYNVKKYLPRWDPVVLHFKNIFTAIPDPFRLVYRGSSYGENAKYIAHFKHADEEDRIVAIYPSDVEIRKFRDFTVTEESLKSKESLERFSKARQRKGF